MQFPFAPLQLLTKNSSPSFFLEAIKKPAFQTTAKSQRILDNQLLCARIHAMLVNFSLMIEVQANDGVITLCNIGEVLRTDSSLRIKIEEMISNIEGVKEIQFGGKVCARAEHINPFYNI